MVLGLAAVDLARPELAEDDRADAHGQRDEERGPAAEQQQEDRERPHEGRGQGGEVPLLVQRWRGVLTARGRLGAAGDGLGGALGSTPSRRGRGLDDGGRQLLGRRGGSLVLVGVGLAGQDRGGGGRGAFAQGQDRVAQLDLVTRLQLNRLVNARAVYPGAVGRAQILELDPLTGIGDARVLTRDPSVIEHQVAVAVAPQRQLAAAQVEIGAHAAPGCDA